MTAKTNQKAAARPRCACVHSALVVGTGGEAVCTSSPSSEVSIGVSAARPIAGPSCRAELKMAPTVPAADDGVEAKMAKLIDGIRTGSVVQG
jgi:hypothetical protein